MAVASRSTEQQSLLVKEVRAVLGRKMLVESERSLDLLYGILVYTGWSQSHIHTNPIITTLQQLAIGLLGDLGLKRPPLQHLPHFMLNYDGRDYANPVVSSKRTIGERRVAVGVYWMSSMLSMYFQRVESLRWTPYLDDCLQVLRESGDCPTDAAFVFLARLQLLTEKALDVTSHDDLGVSRNSFQAPPALYMKSLLAQLRALQLEIPVELQGDESVLLHLHSTELSIHEILLSSSPVPGPNTTISSAAPSFERIDAFFGCLKAIKSWCDVLFSMPSAAWAGFSMATFTQLAHCIIMLYRISTTSAEAGAGCDAAAAREIVDFSAVLGSAIERMEGVKAATGLDIGGRSGARDVYSLAAGRFQTIKDWWDAKMLDPPATTVLAAQSNDQGEEVAGNDSWPELVDDAWLRDILGLGWDEFQFEHASMM